MTTIFVGHLPGIINDAKIQNLFEKYGKVLQFIVKKNHAFITLDNREDAQRAIRELNGECKTQPELALLDLIELVIEYGILDVKNIFYENMNRSGIIEKIANILISKIDLDENSNQTFSEIIIKLLIAYFKVMKGHQIDWNMLKLFVLVEEATLKVLRL
ncbi:MAG: hypothetical protein EZS28_006796 [Streblomastix strix]|uniref:RRM domain-containing protein n=1 Tax=Streblomastix strix TaxID=222440 RepID=A0A5J4WRZ9_9EUKA|nr:MAG: hypothetical protein EZS28_006796 [Streblomastix strix]